MWLLFPDGWKCLIACLRDYLDDINDPQLRAQVKEFMYQEGQHGMVHTAFNDHLKSQGIAVDHIRERQKQIMFGFFRKYLPKTFKIGRASCRERVCQSV